MSSQSFILCRTACKSHITADALGGVVLNRAQQYIWERGNKKTKTQMDTAELPEAILAGTMDIKNVEKER